MLFRSRQHQDPWRGLPDLDLVLEGRAADLVQRLPAALERQFGSPVPIREQHHGRYGTAELELELPPECGGIWLLDVASARQESYPQPGVNPVVSPGSLEQDLARRDFTVNAMALVLNPSGEGGGAELELLDPFGGQADLARRQLRFLHPQSLRDDPTRLLRAARYAARLAFELAPEALDQVRTTLQAWPWDWRLGDDPDQAPPALATRLRMELELLLEREPWPVALALLQRWGGLALLDPGLQRDRTWGRRLRWAARLGAPALPALLAAADDPLALVRRLQLPHGQQALLSLARQLEQHLPQIPWPSLPSQWCAQLEAQPGGADAVALLLAMGVQPRRPLLRWWCCWRHVASPLDGAALRQRGWPQGPALGAELKRLRAEELDRQCQP